ncbi:MAG: zinc ABC transporter substrate-binding protein [Kaiparowitsia implicata GSE-PSE-MK54-09C]|nr:zinc ABC transporter substrate-binding protein [Kaiparowitsia implicata GSE-PSE-MK54-09C]
MNLRQIWIALLRRGRFRFRIPLATLSLALVAGCGFSSTPQTGETAANSRLSVVASYSVLCSMVEQVADDAVDLACLIDYDRDPHTYEATPADRRAIEQADATFYAGMNFEPSVIQMVEATRTNAPKVAVHEVAVEDTIEVQDTGALEPDPHIWHDVANGIRMVALITETLTEIDPDNAAQYAARAADLTAELEQLHAWIPEQIATIPENQRRLVTTHDAMNYYARAYGFTVEGTLLGLTTEQEPTAAQVRRLSESIQAANIPTVFAELTSNDRVLATVANEANVEISDRVLIADGIGQQGTPSGSYQGMVEYNTCVIAEGLGGRCVPFAGAEE